MKWKGYWSLGSTDIVFVESVSSRFSIIKLTDSEYSSHVTLSKLKALTRSCPSTIDISCETIGTTAISINAVEGNLWLQFFASNDSCCICHSELGYRSWLL